LINEIFSNDFINNGGWKILYLIVSSIILVIFILSQFYFKKKLILILDLDNEKSFSFVQNFANSFILFIPFLCFLLFSFSNWLPKFSNPDNLYFLSFGFLYLFLINLILIFITPLANLVGRKKSVIFLNLSILIISSICSFIDHSSSYSIDFLKFFLSMVSSFTVCCFILQQKVNKAHENSNISSLNLCLFTAALFVSPLVFFSVNFSINYSVIYIFLSIVYFINYMRIVLKKDG
jgi:peptidoglycan/LPS O-acetylase OafA/YrhL